jgi:predicted RNA-binding Zn ribbon-like protein
VSENTDLVTASLALVLPDEPLPVRLMNTIWADRHGVYDALDTVPNLRAWLAAVRPVGDSPSPDAGELARFRALRDALRRLAAVLTDDTRPKAASPVVDVRRAVAEVNRAVALAPAQPRLTFQDGQLRLAPAGQASPAQRALSAIAGEAMTLMAAEDQVGLRACDAPGCVLYFVNRHPRREWCSTACGNRARAARHYQRHHTTPS